MTTNLPGKKTFWGNLPYPVSIMSLLLLIFSIHSCQKEPLVKYPTQSDNVTALENKDEKDKPFATVTVFATGLNNPRGLKFGPDGALYVAEGGVGGTGSSVGCEQVIPPVGPYTGSTTGARISKISHAGVRTTFADNFPSSQTSMATGSLVSGVADIAFIDHKMYALLAGAGCSHGVASIPNGIVKVNANGSWNFIANLSEWQHNHPVKNPEEDDFEPDGSWYSIVSVHDDLYALEANHGELVKVNPRNGHISRVIDISASQGHIVPTAMAYNGNFFIGNLNPFPIIDGSSNIYKITPSGQIKIFASGFTTILGVAFDREDHLYILENTTGNLFPTPGTGKILRIDRSGNTKTIATGLSLPTAMTYGPDGNLYVSNWGFGPPPIGLGQVLKIELKNNHHED